MAAQPILLGGGALGQSGSDCSNPNQDDPPPFNDAPLWISEVSFELAEGQKESYAEGRVAFVNPGDLVKVQFTIVNRVPEDCKDVFQLSGQPVDNVEVRRWLDEGLTADAIGDPGQDEAGRWLAPDQPANGACPSDSLQEPGGTCSVTDFIRLPDNDALAEDGSDAGEYHVRYVAGNGGGTWTALAGAERVLVVGVKPDLKAKALNPTMYGQSAFVDDLITTYGGGDTVGAEINVTNEGSYPYWNPNGGELFWGRSSYDGDSSDVNPTQVDTCRDFPCAGPGYEDSYEPSEENRITIQEIGPDHRPVFCLEDNDDDGDSNVTETEAQAYLPDFARWCNGTDHSPGNPGEWEYQSAPPWKWDVREREYKAKTVDAPPCIGDDEANRTSPWTQVADNVDASDLICSYRRGARLEMPLAYSITNPDTGKTVEQGVIPSDSVHAPATMSEDKDDAVVHDDVTNHPAREQSFEIRLFSTDYNAGDHEVKVSLTRTADGWLAGPETEHSNNNATGNVDIQGVDLRIAKASIVKGEGLSCGTKPSNPCPVNATIHLTASYENVGDGEFDAIDLDQDENRCDGWQDNDEPSPRDRCWKAAAYLGGELVRWDERGMSAISELDKVPKTPENAPSPTDLWPQSLHIEPDQDGGEQILEVRLDHQSLYDSARDVGRVGEKTELNSCPGSDETADNVWCTAIYFEDETTPVVHDISIDAPHDQGGTPATHEGENATFQAEVTDNSLEMVEAIFELPNGTTQTAVMSEDPDQASQWTVNRSFEGVLGNATYTIVATDAFGHTVSADENRTLTVLELPKTTKTKRLTINGQNLTQGDDTPTYQGTPDAPENWIRIEANITGTGQADAWSTQGKNVTLFDRTGVLQHDVPMDVYVVCDIFNNVTDEHDGEGHGDECDQSNEDEMTDIRDRRPRFFIDTRCEDGTDPEPHAADCQDVSEELRSVWKDIELDWAGDFNVRVKVTDVFNRTRNETTQVTLADPDGPPVLEDVVLQPKSLQPGDELDVSARAADGLKVERVYLDAVKPDGSQATFNLTLDPDQTEDADTGNGTYTKTLASGAHEALDQAGTYNLTVVAVDFAGKTNTSDPVEIPLEDTDTPTIEALKTLPNGTQEAGGPVSWQAKITDSSAIKPPLLTVHKPASGSTTYELAYNASTGVYETPEPVETTQADVGTWGYLLKVEDYAGHTTQAEGSIEIVEQLPPQAIDWKPDATGPAGATYGPAQPTIRVDIVDYGDGVDRSSIEMTLDGDPVSPMITEIDSGYRLEIPTKDADAYSHGDTILVEVSAKDLAEPPQEADGLKHQFIVDARPPNGSLEVRPSIAGDDARITGRDAEVHATVQDPDAGPGPTRVELIRGSGMAAQAKTIEAGTPIALTSFEEAYKGHGAYTLVLVPSDAVGNEANRTTREIFVDEAGPSITVFPKPGEPREKVFADLSDRSPIEKARILYSVDGEQQDPIPMERANGTWKGKIPSLPDNTTIEFHVEATDYFGNTGASTPVTFQAGHELPPVEITSPEEGATLTGEVTVTWEARDPENPEEEVLVSIFYKDGQSPTPIPGAQEIANDGRHVLDTTELPNGELGLQVIAFDGKVYGEDTVTVHVRNLAEIFSDPRIEDADAGDGVPTLPPATERTFSVDLTEPASAVRANVTRDGHTVSSHKLEPTDGSQGTWQGTLTLPKEPGSYEIDLTAVTPDGPVETTGAYGFEVASETSAEGSTFGWVLLSALFASAVVVAGVGLASRWS